MLTQNYFSIDSLSTPWSHDQYSESRFKRQPSATDKSRTLKIWKKQKTEMQTSWALLFWPEIKSHTKRWPSSRTIPSYLKYLEELWGKEKGEKTQTKWKQNRRLLKNLLQGQLSMECILVFRLPTHAEHQKLGLSLSPILTISGYCGATGAVLNSNTLCLCRMHKHQHKLIKQKGVSFYLAFIFLSHTLKHLSLVQFSKSDVQHAAYFFIHSYHQPCCTFSILT